MISNDDQVAANVDHSLSIAEAAEPLGVSLPTIRRRIKQGEIRAYQRPTTRGFEWHIILDQASASILSKDDQSAINVAQRLSPELMKVLEMLEAERDEVKRLQTENGELRDSANHWQARYIQVQETLQRLLPAPKDDPAEERPAPAEQPVQQRSWWKRLFR